MKHAPSVDYRIHMMGVSADGIHSPQSFHARSDHADRDDLLLSF